MARLSILPVIRGHWKGLSNDLANGKTVPDWRTRSVLLGVSAGVLAATYILGWQVASPSATLSAMALLSAGLLGVFTQLSALRIRLTSQPEDTWLDVERDGIDEAVAHVLFAFLLCIINSALLVIALNTIPTTAPANCGVPPQMVDPTLATPPVSCSIPPQVLDSWWSGPILAIGSYIVLMLIILIPKLYSAYVEMNEVRRELNGFHKKRKTV